MSIHAVAGDRQATPDVQVIAELAAGALESIARIHAAGLAQVAGIAENPVVVHEPQSDVQAPAGTPAPAEAEVQTEVRAEGEVEAAEQEPATAEFVTPAGTDLVQPVEALRAVPQPTRGRHLSEAETTEFAAQRAA